MNSKYKEVRFSHQTFQDLKIRRNKDYFKARTINKRIRKYVKNKLRSFIEIGKIIFFGK